VIELQPEKDFSQAADRQVDVSVIVVSFNTKDLLERCLKSIRQSAGGMAIETIVIDNASVDGSADLVSEQFPDIVLVRNAHNRGFGAAVNQGLRIATGEFILLLNSDALLMNDSLTGLTSYLKANLAVGLTSCRLVDASGATQPSASDLPNLWMQVASFYGLKRLVPSWTMRRLLNSGIGAAIVRRLSAGHIIPQANVSGPVEVEFLSGACLMMRRQVWEGIGDFDENIFLYLEDADWCRRAVQHGWRLAYLPQPVVVHRGGESFKALTGGHKSRVSLERCRSLLYYFRKHETASQLFLLKAVIVSSMLARLFGLGFRRLLGGINRVDGARKSTLYMGIIKQAVRG